MSAPNPVLSVRDLHVQFGNGIDTVRAVNGVDLELEAGERLAIVGESGSGKSVMSLAVLDLLPRAGVTRSGRVVVNGQDVFALSESQLNRVRGRDIAMVFQDPMTSLDPVIKVGRQMTAPMRRNLQLGAASARARAIELLADVGIPDPERVMGVYPHQLSGGMCQRAMIAIALSCEPALVVADEPTTSLDVTVQAQIIQLLTRLSEERGTAMILVTHDLGIVARFAQRVAVMYAGRFVEVGPVEDVYYRSQHPYTQGLLRAIPRPDIGREIPLSQIRGAPPDPSNLPAGCAFAPRCGHAVDRCVREVPTLTTRSEYQHLARCWVTDVGRDVLERVEVGR